MGCASSKPSSKSKSKSGKNKTETKSAQQSTAAAANAGGKAAQPAVTNGTAATKLNVNGGALDHQTTAKQQTSPLHLKQQQQQEKLKKLNQHIQIDNRYLAHEIDHNRNRVITYIVALVHRDLNADLIANGSKHLAEVVLAASSAHDNDDLITDVVSRAVLLILNTNSGQQLSTYKELNDNLKSHSYLCKNQAHKNRICDLTTDTIRTCLDSLNEEINQTGDRFSLLEYLNAHDPSSQSQSQSQSQPLTPPQTPQQQPLQEGSNHNHVQQQQPNEEDVVLLSRSEAKEVARILFLSDRARPVVHASPKSKDAYYVNKQLSDNSEITVSQKEIDEILNSFNKQEIIEIKDDYYQTSTNQSNHTWSDEPLQQQQQHTPNVQNEQHDTLHVAHVHGKPHNLIDDINQAIEQQEHEQLSHPKAHLTTTVEHDLTTVTIDNDTNDITIQYETDIVNIDNGVSVQHQQQQQESAAAAANDQEVVKQLEDDTNDSAIAAIAAASALIANLSQHPEGVDNVEIVESGHTTVIKAHETHISTKIEEPDDSIANTTIDSNNNISSSDAQINDTSGSKSNEQNQQLNTDKERSKQKKRNRKKKRKNQF